MVKVNYDEIMSDKNKQNLITRNIIGEIKLLKRTKYFSSTRKSFLISDSKGFDLKRIENTRHIRFFCKSGANITHREVRSYAKYQVKNNKYPIILLWFGTCALTEKSNGLFVLKNNITDVVENTISEYRELKNELVTINPRAKIVFLDCPYYSLSTFNKHKNKTFANNFFDEQQKELKVAIDLHNDKLRDLNGNIQKIPCLNKDFSKRTSSKKRKPKIQIDYRQLRDGCHIGRLLAELWLLRIKRLIYRI